jgi:hypothetical protein
VPVAEEPVVAENSKTLDFRGFDEPKLPIIMEASRGELAASRAVGIFAGVYIVS